MPSKRIIILDGVLRPRPQFRFAMWADVPAARQSFYSDPTKTSAWNGASLSENTAIKNGQVVEIVDQISVEPTPGETMPLLRDRLRSFLETRWSDFQSQVSGDNPWRFFGSFWDGTSWTNTGVA